MADEFSKLWHSEIVNMPKPKRTMRVVLENDNWFDFETPDDFNLIGFVSAIRAAGYILNDAVYQPIEDIRTIFIYVGDKPQGPGVVLPFNKLESKP